MGGCSNCDDDCRCAVPGAGGCADCEIDRDARARHASSSEFGTGGEKSLYVRVDRESAARLKVIAARNGRAMGREVLTALRRLHIDAHEGVLLEPCRSPKGSAIVCVPGVLWADLDRFREVFERDVSDHEILRRAVARALLDGCDGDKGEEG